MKAPTAASQRAHASWGRLPPAPPARVETLVWRDALPDLRPPDGPVLAYGQGRSYGDACLNGGGVLLDTRGLDRVLAFDRARGLLRCEAGVTLADVLALVVPHGWFLPVTPGTRYVSVAGAVAHDVHGKNHHVAGTFGRFVTRLELVRSTGERLELAPDGPHADLFAATVAGLGLTGLITWVEFRLLPVETDRIDAETVRFGALAEFFDLSRQHAATPYTVAWLDALSPDGRGVFAAGRHSAAGPGLGLPAPGALPEARLGVPFDAPSWALGPHAVRAFNAVYSRKPAGRARVPYVPFFYPLDAVRDWNRGYGRRGFYQYQFVVPHADGHAAVREILRRIAASGAGSFLAVLKTFGALASPGLLSFPRPGVTLALDFANRGEATVGLLRGLDAVVRDAGGAVYPAKDALMTPESFRAFFPQWEALARLADPGFSSSFWRRVTSDL